LKGLHEVDTYGKHILVDIWIKEDIPPSLRSIMVQCAVATGATIMTEAQHQFTPYGETGAFILSESHLTWHTFPEKKYISIDCYTCGNVCDPKKILEILETHFTIEDDAIKFIERGIR
jgi:S-adenosylmethionine decarboxylase